jgi:hypothetical protein
MARVEIEIKNELLNSLSEAIFWQEEAEKPPSVSPDPAAQPLLVENSYLRICRVKGLAIVVWADEHPPPHFHVKYQGMDASFSIVDGTRLPGGRGLEKYERTIRSWWEHNQTKLIEVWNTTRPSDCPVGPILARD